MRVVYCCHFVIYPSFLSFCFLKTWDDVIRKEKPKEKPFNYHLNKPLDQEKSKLSLAEVYEQEYLKQVQVQGVCSLHYSVGIVINFQGYTGFHYFHTGFFLGGEVLEELAIECVLCA